MRNILSVRYVTCFDHFTTCTFFKNSVSAINMYSHYMLIIILKQKRIKECDLCGDSCPQNADLSQSSHRQWPLWTAMCTLVSPWLFISFILRNINLLFSSLSTTDSPSSVSNKGNVHEKENYFFLSHPSSKLQSILWKFMKPSNSLLLKVWPWSHPPCWNGICLPPRAPGEISDLRGLKKEVTPFLERGKHMCESWDWPRHCSLLPGSWVYFWLW